MTSPHGICDEFDQANPAAVSSFANKHKNQRSAQQQADFSDPVVGNNQGGSFEDFSATEERKATM